MAESRQRWAGGYILNGVFVIRRQIHGKRYIVSTRARSSRAAHKQLERFEADPANYQPEGASQPLPIYLDATLAEEFLKWSRDELKNSQKWVNEQRDHLAWWADQLVECDLRNLSLVDRILPAIEGVPSRPHRIAVLKRLYSYLRKIRHLLTYDEDPTFQTLSAPPSKPAQWKRTKVIPQEHVRLAMDHMTGPYRLGLAVLAGTGWNVTELVRFVRGGSIEPLPQGAEGAGVLVCPQTKAGAPLRVIISEAVLAAGQSLRARGKFSQERFEQAIKRACTAAKIPPFTPGRMRHSIATHAINSGADMAAVANFLNHKSPRTTARYYATHGTPRKVPTLL
jgi:integrase